MIDRQVPTPKHGVSARIGQSAFYQYYAGFSSQFARAMLQVMTSEAPGLVLDPWNGAGTTTASCAELGLQAVGSDLNPAMAVVAKGRLLAGSTAGSVLPLTERILRTTPDAAAYPFDHDPLRNWFSQRAACALRQVERAAFITLVGEEEAESNDRLHHVLGSSDLASFFYIGMFNVVRELLHPRRATNPTWVKRPRSEDEKIDASPEVIEAAFRRAMEELTASLLESSIQHPSLDQRVEIRLGDSTSIRLEDESVSTVLTSPPYCTRIDYAVATSGELALLGVGEGPAFQELRKQLMGTATIGTEVEQSILWGPECMRFLDRVYRHPSVASSTYYYKSHCQYFGALYDSIGEIARVLRKGGVCTLVVQNSYYKEILNDLPQICIEMAESYRMVLSTSKAFEVRQSFSQLNSASRRYRRASNREWEEVVVLTKH